MLDERRFGKPTAFLCIQGYEHGRNDGNQRAIGGFKIDSMWLRGDDGLSISDALINIDKTDRSVYIGGQPNRDGKAAFFILNR